MELLQRTENWFVFLFFFFFFYAVMPSFTWLLWVVHLTGLIGFSFI